MKKFIALLMALILGLIGVTMSIKTNKTDINVNTVQVDIDRTETDKAIEWTKAYYGRCARYRMATTKRAVLRNNLHRIMRRAGRIAALPAMLALGAMSGYSVHIATPDAARVDKATNEAEARKIANAEYARAKDAKESVLIAVNNGDKAVAKATRNVAVKNDDDDKVAAYAKEVSSKMPAEQGQPGTDEQRTNNGRWPRWMVSAYDNNGDRIATYKCRSRHHAEQCFDSVEADGQDAIIWHNLAAAKVSNVIVGSFRELRKIKTAHPTVIGPHYDGTVMQGVTPTMKHLGDAEIVKINAEIKGNDEEKLARRRAQWAFNISHGFVWNGERFAVYGHGTNAAKDCAVKATKADKVAELRNWQLNGASPNWKVAIAKYFAYAGLMDVALAMNYPVWLKADSEVILTTLVKEIVGNIANIDATGTIDGPTKKSCEQKCSDGQAVISFSKKYVTKILSELKGKERKAAKEFFKNLKGHSFRWPLQKGFAVVLKIDGMQSVLRKYGVKEINGKDIDDIVIFADETVFKGSFGENGSHRDWAEYCSKLEELHDENSRGMLLINHGVNRPASNVSGQFWRAMIGAEKNDVVTCMHKEIAYIKWLISTPEGLGELVGGPIGKLIAAGHTELLRLRPIAKRARKKLDVIIMEAKQGRFHNVAHNLAWATDIFSWVLNACGIKKVFIPAGVVIVPGAKWIKNGQKGLIGRSPIQNDSGVQVVTLYNSFAAAGIENGELLDKIVLNDGTAYGSAGDLVDTALEADHDGDHVFIITDEDYVNMVIRRNERLAAIGWDNVIVKADTGKALKDIVTPERCKTYLAKLTDRVGVGKPDDLMSKLVGYLPVGEVPTFDIMLDTVQVKWFMQDAVDAGKNELANADKFAKRNGVLQAENREIPYAQDLAKSERRHVDMKERDSYEFCDGTLDFIRANMQKELKDIKLDVSNLPKLDEKAFYLNDAERNPALYNFMGKAEYRFFKELKDGELAYESTKVFRYASMEDAKNNIMITKDGTKMFGRIVGGDKIIYAELASFGEDEDRRIINVSGHDVPGKYICNEANSPVFTAMEGRVRTEYYDIMKNDNDEQRQVAKTMMANKGEYAHKAIEALASFYGVTGKATFNKLVPFFFADRDWDNPSPKEFIPNEFSYQWLEAVYPNELRELLTQDEPEHFEAIVADDAYIPDEVDELNNLIGECDDNDMDFDMGDLSID